MTGIDEHEMRNLKIGTFGGIISTQRGEVIAIFNQSAYHPQGKSILSCLQVEDNGITVHDKLLSHEGYVNALKRLMDISFPSMLIKD